MTEIKNGSKKDQLLAQKEDHLLAHADLSQRDLAHLGVGHVNAIKQIDRKLIVIDLSRKMDTYLTIASYSIDPNRRHLVMELANRYGETIREMEGARQ